METDSKPSLLRRLRTVVIGGSRDLRDRHLFHKLSLIAFFAWVGFGADGLTSSCYGPEEAFRTLGAHKYLSIFVALGTAVTILVISGSYSQLIELFPTGGGGYLVASKLLSPSLGMIAGCALLIDYVLTISLSIASGADALFSFLPPSMYRYKLGFAVAGVILLIVMNLRGVKESVVPLLPIFLMFLLTHAFAILYALVGHLVDLGRVAQTTAVEIQQTTNQLGLVGMVILVLRAYSMGAGTYTGIEAVSNGMMFLREPRVQTGKRTMRYMAFSLAFTVVGLMIAYLLYQTEPHKTKTLNAILFETMARDWGTGWGKTFVYVTLFSEAALLFVAAQTGFLGGPAVLANMALDRWFPSRFSSLSDRFVTQNGILIMGGAALVTMILAGGSVRTLVVLYSINVFITFCLSQSGMVRHWWSSRSTESGWRGKILVNGVGLVLCLFILIMVVVLKFKEGGWVTLAVTGGLIMIAVSVRSHYNRAGKLLRRLDTLVKVAEDEDAAGAASLPAAGRPGDEPFDPKAKTAILLVNGFSGLGLHTLLSVIRMFEGVFKNFVFVQIGVVDAGNFKGLREIDHLRKRVESDINRYVSFMRRHGYHAEGRWSIGTDIVEEVAKTAPNLLEKYPGAVFFGGQLVFPEDSFMTRLLHNYVVFSVQRQLYRLGIPFVILPVRL